MTKDLRHQVGDIVDITGSFRVYTEIPRHFIYVNAKGDWRLGVGYVYPKGEFEYLQGEYEVKEIRWVIKHDNDPYEHRVICVKTDPSRREIYFYQKDTA